ncbi:MAG: hypothetical protein WBZ36_01125 [Candidatus Nitrosopolaris sp.]
MPFQLPQVVIVLVCVCTIPIILVYDKATLKGAKALQLTDDLMDNVTAKIGFYSEVLFGQLFARSR